MTTSPLKSHVPKASSRPRHTRTLSILLILAAAGYLGCNATSTVHAATFAGRTLYMLADFGSGNATAAELGVELYPGSTQRDAAVRMKTSANSFVTVKFVTSDSQDKVVDFYKAKLGPKASLSYNVMFDKRKSAILLLRKGAKETVEVTIVPNSPVDNGKTQITLLHTFDN